MAIKRALKKYIEDNIIPEYEKNDEGHNSEHVKRTIRNSLELAKAINGVDQNMVYAVAAYHDVGHHIDAKNHEKISAKILLNDEGLKKYFSGDEIKVMADAVYDHRSSIKGEPRNVYGKIISSADKMMTVDDPLKRTYAYRLVHNPDCSLEETIEESRQHILNKFGQKGYGVEKMYYGKEQFKKFLHDITTLAENEKKFKSRYIKVNGLDNPLKLALDEAKRHNPDMPMDELLYVAYEKIDPDRQTTFDEKRSEILKASGINEFKYYTKNVNTKLKNYINKYIFPEYAKNDGGHNLAHIREVIRRCFALNDTFRLNLDPDTIYAIAACHDWGKYVDHEKHHLIAAENFIKDENFRQFFTDEQRRIIKEAIEDHRSSKEDAPRSTYGKLISSADRNTSIEIVFIRSFFVAHERMPDVPIEEYLDYTIDRLSKRYSEENPENMFYEDNTYKVFLQDMRALLKREKEFKDKYCLVNHITNRKHMVKDEPGAIEYLKADIAQ